LAVVLNEVDCVEGAQPGEKFFGVEFDNLLSCLGRLLTRTYSFLHDALEVVHRVEVDIAEVLDLGFDVPWNGDVDHEDGPVLASLERAFHGSLAKDRQGAGG
jgi:hypothetical protein